MGIIFFEIFLFLTIIRVLEKVWKLGNENSFICWSCIFSSACLGAKGVLHCFVLEHSVNLAAGQPDGLLLLQ